jgi:hypothetical protein
MAKPNPSVISPPPPAAPVTRQPQPQPPVPTNEVGAADPPQAPAGPLLFPPSRAFTLWPRDVATRVVIGDRADRWKGAYGTVDLEPEMLGADAEGKPKFQERVEVTLEGSGLTTYVRPEYLTAVEGENHVA